MTVMIVWISHINDKRVRCNGSTATSWHHGGEANREKDVERAPAEAREGELCVDHVGQRHLGADVNVIQTPPCMFRMENH